MVAQSIADAVGQPLSRCNSEGCPTCRHQALNQAAEAYLSPPRSFVRPSCSGHFGRGTHPGCTLGNGAPDLQRRPCSGPSCGHGFCASGGLSRQRSACPKAKTRSPCSR
jgi:hypothetical protein